MRNECGILEEFKSKAEGVLHCLGIVVEYLVSVSLVFSFSLLKSREKKEIEKRKRKISI